MNTKTAKSESASGPNIAGLIAGLIVVFVLAYIARWLKIQVYDIKDIGLGIPGKALEYPLWAAIVGLIANWIFKAVKVHEFLRPGFRTELFLKIGLVLLGCTISFKVIITAAAGA